MFLHSLAELKRTTPSCILLSSFLLKPTSNPPFIRWFRSPYHSNTSPILNLDTPLIPEDPPSNYNSLLKTFIDKKLIRLGKQVHGRIYVSGRGFDIGLATKLINLYSVCDRVYTAHQLFDRIPKGNPFLWNVLIRGYASSGPYNVAISLYYQMMGYGLVPNNYTFPFVLKACAALSSVKEGRAIHKDVVTTGWDTNVFVGAALVDMYAKCGCVGRAKEVFDKILDRDVGLWNSMLAAYAHNGHPDDCLSLCSEFACVHLSPSEATLVTVVSAAADIAALLQGRELHGFSWKHGFESHDKVNTALVDMYAKGGALKLARNLFDRLSRKRLVSWNSMISGYAMHGHASEALNLFEEMKELAEPDHITFVGALQACNHGGLLDEGWKIFNSLVRDYQINPTVQHYTCMVDLLGHCGRLDDAYHLISQMKVPPDSGVWGALLNSCKIHANIELGELAFQKLTELEPNDPGNYVIMSNLYGQAGKWDRVPRLRKMMIDKNLRKSIACSWIEVKTTTHSFLSGDTSHPKSDDIYAELERLGELMRRAGYVPNTTPVYHDVEDDDKTSMICSHSERLAIAFGLISTPPGTRLLITKNLRVCEDCHVAIKFISKITEREMIVRDVNRYHHFKDGTCSCGDHW